MNLGGIGSVAQAQDQMASTELSGFNVSLSVGLINKAQDWACRQKIEYASLVGLMSSDFLSLTDWDMQIGLYSKANPIQLSGPQAAIQALTKLNQKFVLSKLIEDPELGLKVGRYLESIDNFADVVSAPQEIVQNASQLAGSLGVD